jgi:hypothetical protein
MYIDDSLWSGQPEKIHKLAESVFRLFDLLGWTLSEKAMKKPSYKAEFLGFLIDATKHTVEIPAKKIDRCMTTIHVMLARADEGKTVSVKDLQRLTGYLISFVPAIPCIRAWTRALYRTVAKTLEPLREDARLIRHVHGTGYKDKYFPKLVPHANLAPVKLTEDCIFELFNIIGIISERNGTQILTPKSSATIYVDSGLVAWGGHILGRNFTGFFDSEVVSSSSTRREMTGAREMLCKATAEFPEIKHYKLAMDSSASVQNFTKYGGKVEELCFIARDVHEWALRFGQSLSFQWLSRETANMVIADAEGRKLMSGWRLNRPLYQQLREQWPNYKIILPKFGAISHVIDTTVSLGRLTVLVLPRWISQRWWPKAVNSANTVSTLFKAENAIHHTVDKRVPPWDMVVMTFGAA